MASYTLAVREEPVQSPSDLVPSAEALEVCGLAGVHPELVEAYEQLRLLAHGYFRQQPGARTLQPTALVNEALTKLLRSGKQGANADGLELDRLMADPQHFFATAARAMRQVLVDHARARRTHKRGGGQARLSLREDTDGPATPRDGLLADPVEFDDLLRALERHSPRAAQLIELRFFGALTVEHAANLMGVSRSAAEAEWRFARAWLLKQLA